ncbi:MAG: radical SAM protein [Thermoplasmata archaeon]
MEMVPTEDAFSRLWIWEKVGDRLPWYVNVASNRIPAKYLIAQRVPCDLDLSERSDAELWAEHQRGTELFLDLWKGIREGGSRLEDLPRPPTSLVDLSVELTLRMLRRCIFCRWNCRIDRSAGTKHGTCQLEAESRVSSYFHHRGEELVFRGTRGSGTVFFTSCNLRCAHCQNSDISHDKDRGIPMTPNQLAAAAWQLRMEGCHNINWVGGDPTIHLHTIVQAIALLAKNQVNLQDMGYVSTVKADFGRPLFSEERGRYDGEFNVPMLWNSNFFMSPETMQILRPLIDVWLPDFKFGNDKCSVFLARTPWYWETVSRNHQLVYDWGEDMVIRHLVMPNHVDCCTKPVLDWIAAHTPQALVNVMDQYHPDHACNPTDSNYDPQYEELARRPYDREIREAYDHAAALGLRFEDVTFEKAQIRRIFPRMGS